MNKPIFVAILVAASAATVLSGARADSCKGVDLKIDNKSDKLVKVNYALYKCEGENEHKERFSNVEAQPGQVTIVASNQNLQGCGGRKMERVEYQYQARCDNRWSSDRSVRDTSFQNAFCSSDTGKVYVVQLSSATCD